MDFDLLDLLTEATSLEQRVESLTPQKHDRSSKSNAAMGQEVRESKPIDASVSGNFGFEKVAKEIQSEYQ